MNDHDRKVLKTIRNDLRNTLQTSERRTGTVTEYERLEEISFQLARTLKTLEHQIQSKTDAGPGLGKRSSIGPSSSRSA